MISRSLASSKRSNNAPDRGARKRQPQFLLAFLPSFPNQGCPPEEAFKTVAKDIVAVNMKVCKYLSTSLVMVEPEDPPLNVVTCT